jgi:hypothetical protein
MVKGMRKRVRTARGKGKKMMKEGSSGLMLSRTPMRSHELIAPRYRTSMLFEFAGNNNASTTASPVHFEISGNSVYLPGSVTPYEGFEATGAAPAANGTTLGLGLGATNAAGFANLVKLYNSYRVYGSRIILCLRPSTGAAVVSAAQSARCVLVPFVADSASVFRTTPERALVQPFGKELQISAVNTDRYNTISHTIATHTIYGTSMQAVRDEDSFAALANLYPANGFGWSCWYEPIDGNTTNFVITAKVFYDVEFFNKNAITEGNS